MNAKADTVKAASNRVDWDAMESDWRAGIKTKKQMSAEHGVSRAAMDKHWAKLGIERDLTEKIRMEAESLVARDAVTREVTQTRLHATEREVVEANAVMQADVIRAHRADIGRYRRLCQSMLAQLESETDNPEVFEQIGELLSAPDEKGTDKLNDAYRKAISLPMRIDGVKKLAETLKILIGLERQVFGIADNAEGDKPTKPEELNMPPREIARRIAFALSLGLKDAQSANPATPQQ